MKLTIERVDERTVRAYFDALDPLVRENLMNLGEDLKIWGLVK